MHCNYHYVFYPQYYQQHISAATAAILRVILL